MVYSCDGKVEFSAAITPVFSVTWSFRNHSNMLILLLKKHLLSILKTVVLLNILWYFQDSLIRTFRWTSFIWNIFWDCHFCSHLLRLDSAKMLLSSQPFPCPCFKTTWGFLICPCVAALQVWLTVIFSYIIMLQLLSIVFTHFRTGFFWSGTVLDAMSVRCIFTVQHKPTCAQTCTHSCSSVKRRH